MTPADDLLARLNEARSREQERRRLEAEAARHAEEERRLGEQLKAAEERAFAWEPPFVDEDGNPANGYLMVGGVPPGDCRFAPPNDVRWFWWACDLVILGAALKRFGLDGRLDDAVLGYRHLGADDDRAAELGLPMLRAAIVGDRPTLAVTLAVIHRDGLHRNFVSLSGWIRGVVNRMAEERFPFQFHGGPCVVIHETQPPAAPRISPPPKGVPSTAKELRELIVSGGLPRLMNSRDIAERLGYADKGGRNMIDQRLRKMARKDEQARHVMPKSGPRAPSVMYVTDRVLEPLCRGLGCLTDD